MTSSLLVKKLNENGFYVSKLFTDGDGEKAKLLIVPFIDYDFNNNIAPTSKTIQYEIADEGGYWVLGEGYIISADTAKEIDKKINKHKKAYQNKYEKAKLRHIEIK